MSFLKMFTPQSKRTRKPEDPDSFEVAELEEVFSASRRTVDTGELNGVSSLIATVYRDTDPRRPDTSNQVEETYLFHDYYSQSIDFNSREKFKSQNRASFSFFFLKRK